MAIIIPIRQNFHFFQYLSLESSRFGVIINEGPRRVDLRSVGMRRYLLLYKLRITFRRGEERAKKKNVADINYCQLVFVIFGRRGGGRA